MSAELSGVPARVHLGNIVQHFILIGTQGDLNGWSLWLMMTDNGQLPTGSFAAVGTLESPSLKQRIWNICPEIRWRA